MHTVRSEEAADGPEHASNPPSRETARWAAILCFIAAFMCLVGTGWSMYARRATDDSFGRLGEHLPPDTTSALGAMDTLNTVVAVLNAILAVALVVGGIMLLRRKPAGRIVVTVAGTFLLFAPVVTFIISTQIWSRLVAAMSDTSDVEVMRFGPGAGTMIRGVLVALVMLGLVLAPSTKRWLTYQGPSYGQGQPAAVAGPVLDPSLPPPTRSTTLGAAVLSLLGGVVLLFLVVTGVAEALESGASPMIQVVAGIAAAVMTPLAAGLIVGGILLFRRRLSGRTTVVVSWAGVVIAALGLVSAVSENDHRRAGVLSIVILIVVLTVAYAAAAIGLALAQSSRRWCEARTGFGRQTPPGLEHPASMGVAGPLAPEQGQPRPVESPLGADAPEQAPPPAPVAATQRKRVWLITAAAGTVVMLAVAGTAFAFTTISRKPNAVMPHAYGPQIVLPFTGLSWPAYIAVDAAGTVYVADKDRARDTSRVLVLLVGAKAPNTLQVDGLREGGGVAVDVAGTVYVNNGYDGVLALTPGSNAPTKLSFHGTNGFGAAVDTSGAVYVADGPQVRSLAAGDTAPRVLPFVGLDATYVAVDAARTVYVRGKDHKRVLLLQSGSTTQSELPLTGIKGIEGLAVDSEGTLYIADFDGAQVVAFAAGSDTPSVLPITGLRHPSDVAVDATGNVYVSGYGFSDERLVLKLPVALPA